MSVKLTALRRGVFFNVWAACEQLHIDKGNQHEHELHDQTPWNTTCLFSYFESNLFYRKEQICIPSRRPIAGMTPGASTPLCGCAAPMSTSDSEQLELQKAG